MPERFWNVLTSTRFALVIFGVLAGLSFLGTMPGFEAIYRQPFFRVMLGLLGFCTLTCTYRRRKVVPWPVLLTHIGVILTLVGGMISGLGFVKTVNVYEGDTVDRAFRWDMLSDEPLGFSMTVSRINLEYYPVPVKVGVLRGAVKANLFTLKTGEFFALDRYKIRADILDSGVPNLRLTVFTKDGLVLGTADTEGATTLPPDFPYRFKLVAYQDPKLKRMWVNLRLAQGATLLSEGVSEVNGPLHWDGLSFYNTQISTDPAGRKYAGIQIVKDPGRPLVFAGLTIMSLGGILAFSRAYRKTTKSCL